MKRFILCLVLLLATETVCFANLYEPKENDTLFYIKSSDSWILDENLNTSATEEDRIKLTKKIDYAAAAYSKYVDKNETEAFTLATDLEFLFNGDLISIDNNEMKFDKIILKENRFIKKALSDIELKALFPEYEIIKMSQFEHDKLTLKKKFFETKKILLVNDTDEFYYRPTCMVENVQTSPVRGLVNLYKLGNYEFKHFGEHNGKFLIQVKLDRREHKWFWKK